jgi:hypothetical protein
MNKYVLAFLTLLIATQVIYAKRMYKWTDENGKTFFSDNIPPTQKHLKPKTLNRHAQVIKGKYKTKEMRLEEKRSKALKKQQIQLNKQRLQDKLLLSTFDNFEFMLKRHKEELAQLDRQIKALETNLAQLQQQQRIFTDEINKHKLYKKDRTKIKTLQTKIANTKQALAKKKVNQLQIVKKQAINEKRYLFLITP